MNVQELIDALKHFPRDLPVDIHVDLPFGNNAEQRVTAEEVRYNSSKNAVIIS